MRDKYKCKKKYILAMIPTIIFILIVSVYIYSIRLYPMKVGKDLIHENELMLFISKNMTGVQSKFSASSDTSDSEFWHSQINGEVPYELLMAQAENDLIRSKAVQFWAVENGILDDSSYKHFLNEWKERKDSEIQINEKNYYFYRQDKLELTIQEYLSQSTADIEAITSHYNKDPERTMGSVECMIEIIEDGRIISSSEITIDDTSYRSVSESNEQLALNAFLLEIGESISWVDEYGQDIHLTCINRSLGEVIPVSEVLETAHSRYTRYIFEEQLKERIANIDISSRWFSKRLSI